MNDPPTAKEPRSAADASDVLLTAGAQLAAQGGADSAKAAALLDFITSRLALTGGRLPREAAASVAGSLASPEPTVAAKACLALASALPLCTQCGGPGSEEPAGPAAAELAPQLVAALRRHPADVATQAAGMSLLLRMAGCAGCASPTGCQAQDALGAAGTVQAAVAALPLLTAAATAAGTGTAIDAPTAAAPLADGLRALRALCVGHAANTAALAAAGGVPAAASALAAAAADPRAQVAALLLLAELGCRPGVVPGEQQAAAAAVWAAGQAQVERRSADVACAAVWGMARLLRAQLPQAAACHEAAAAVAELQLRGAAVALAMLQACNTPDAPLVKHCLDLLAVAAGEGPAGPLPAGVAAALLSREAAAAVLVLAGRATTLRTRAAALRTMHALCAAGACGLTWQQLAQPAPGAQPGAELAAGGASLAAAALAVAGGASLAVGAPQDALAVQLYGLACVGALMHAVAAHSSLAPGALAASVHEQQLAAAQEAAAAACATLGRHPELLVQLEAAEEAARPSIQLEPSPSGTAPGLPWAEPLGGRTVADAMRGLCAVLRCDTDGLNAADRHGCTLLHRLAEVGAARCLQLLLAEGGPSLDLLARTRGGATALHLATQNRHAACVALLEAATQQAAESRQAALLAELEEGEEDEASPVAGKKGRKKKAVTRSTSFAADQPEGKAAKVASGDRGDEDMPAADADAEAEQGAEAQQQAELQERLLAQQRRDEEYEHALEARRRELAALQQAATDAAAAEAAAGLAPRSGEGEGESEAPQRQPSRGSSEGRDQPGTPDQQEDQPTTPSAQAGAPASALGAGPGAGSSSGGSSSPERDSSSGAGAGADAQSQLLAAASALASGSGASPGPSMPASPFGLGLGALGSAPLSSSGGSGALSDSGLSGGSLFGSPALAGSLVGPASPQTGGLGPGATGASLPFSHGAPLPSAPPLQRPPGLPPLPGRQSALGAAMAAGAGACGGVSAAQQQQDTDTLLSMHLQDALFVGSPTTASAASPGAARGSPPRHPLFAPLGARSPPEADDDTDSSHLLSSSLSCLDDGPLLGRAASTSTAGSGSPSTAAAAAAAKQAAAASAADALMAGLWGAQGSPASSRDSGGEPARLPDLNSDESAEPTRHLWIGNLGTRTPRALLKGLFERFGTVDDVVTFPGRMYAFVNYRTAQEAVLAYETLQDQQVAELTGDRRLLIKYRPAKKAAVHLRALGLADDDGAPTEDRPDLDRDGNTAEPSPRIWLGNIAPTATSKSLHAVLGRFGALTDAAVFPARIGPLGYAFVKFERVEDAMSAFEALSNTVVPPLSGSKQLKMRYKPATDGPAGRSEDPGEPGKAVMVPSRHLWLGNITQKPSDEAVLEVFAAFGRVDSVRVFPVKAYAFVNYADIGSAIKAMQAVDGLAIPQLTGVKPLVMRYQQESGGSAASTPKPPGSACGSVHGVLPRVASDAVLSAALGLGQGLPGPLAGLLGGPGVAGGPSLEATTGAGTSADGSGSDDGLMPVPNLSNKLNPNNVHYDAVLAERYKLMNRREKDLMWAADSLLHPADPARGMMRSHSLGLLPGAGAQPSASAVAAAATAQAQAALSVLLQHQQQQGGAAGGPMLTSQLLALHQLAPAPAPPAQQSQVPSGASVSQLQSVLNNLTALRRTGSLPGPSPGMALGQPPLAPAGGSLPAGMAMPPLAPAQSLPALPVAGPAPGMPSAQQQQEYLQQLLLQQQAAQLAQAQQARLDGYASDASTPSAAVAASPSHHARLGGALPGHGLQRSSTPMLSPALSAGAPLSPDPSGTLPMLHSPQHHHQPLASAFGPLGGPPSPQQPGLPQPGLPAGGGLPQQFFCPLTRQLMSDPVVAADGVTYERHAISEWMAFKDVSPATNLPLAHKLLTPNSVLRSAMLDLLRTHC